MRLLSTLLGLLALQTTVNAQTSIYETFENYASTTALTNNCWSFSGAALSTASVANGINSIQVIATTSGSNGGNSNSAQVVTPFINMVAGNTLSFNVKLNSSLKGQSNRIITFRLQDVNGNYTSIPYTVTYNSSTDHTQMQIVSFPTPTTGAYKLVMDFTGGGDGNTYLYLDNFSYSSTWNYSTGYACAAYAQQAPLPIVLKAFSGNLNGTRVQLNWSVEENETGRHFVIQRSADGSHFTNAAIMAITTKTGSEQYTYSEEMPYASGSFYRLLILNDDNSVSYSRVIALKNGAETTESDKITILQNPIQNNTIRFSFTSPVAETVQVVLYNMGGMVIHTQNIASQQGLNVVNMVLNTDLNYGTYLLQLRSSILRRPIKVTR